MKKKMILIMIGLFLILGVIGLSYALWARTVSQEGINTVQSTCLEIALEDENPITLQNAYPITDEESSLLTPYTFTITNKCSMMEYDVNLDIMESKNSNGESNRLNSAFIAIELDGEEKKLLNTFEEVDTSYQGSDYVPVEGRYLISGELGPKESKTYTLKLWMDEHVTAKDDSMNKNFISKIVVTAKMSHLTRLADHLMSQNEMEEFTHEETTQTTALTDYRYVGSNPNNYIYFGCSDNCTEENLYRIIGVIPTQSEIGIDKAYENRVKIIKSEPYVEQESGFSHESSNLYGYKWNETNHNRFETATINTEILNKTYWNSLGEYQKYIAPSLWYLGAINHVTHQTGRNNPKASADIFYQAIRGDKQGYSKGALNYIGNIGLIYYDDYLFAAGTQYRSTPYNNIPINVWLQNKNMTIREWTISPEESYLNSNTYTAVGVFVHSDLIDASIGAVSLQIHSIRPTFYLKSNVLYESGKGTIEDPYRINMKV